MDRALASSPVVVESAAREEELERQHPAGRLHVLLVGHPADGALVHVDDFGDLAQRERLQVLHALFEELALPVHDEVHHLQHRLAALLDGLDHPVGAVHPLVDELLVLALELLLVARDVLIDLGNAQPRQAGVVQEDVVLAVNLVDDEVRDDVVVVRRGVLQAGLGIELRELVGRGLHLGGRQPKALGQVAPAVGDEVVERLFHQPIGQRVRELGVLELQQQAFAQVARPTPGGSSC